MMKLSVIIVNYNVETLLEQCLRSVENAMLQISGEIIVVDNASADGSIQMIRAKFPNIRLIENSINEGFSKANNRGIKIAQGEYLLLLNPDTLVPHDCFTECIEFMHQKPSAGALGVRMIDATGRYLPESKRGLPTPWVAFCKFSGLTKLFPKSKRFARYYLGHLPNDKTSPIEVLAGAFMFLRRTALEKSGLLDESFFMYGEDIDLSYRITQCGFQNYFLPQTSILHYKGESTRKGSLNYVVLFYRAMLIFSKKHFSNRHNGLFNLMIYLAIYFRALLSVLSRFAKALLSPLGRFFNGSENKKERTAIIIASQPQALKIKDKSRLNHIPIEIVSTVSPRQLDSPTNFKEELLQLKTLIDSTRADLLIFNAKEVSATTIIQCIDLLGNSKTRFRIETVE